MTPRITYPSTHDGWQLELEHFSPVTPNDRPPLLFIPGYGMNTFILSYHPSGKSMVEYLRDRGWDVWTCNLRGQGGARPIAADRDDVSLAQLALIDIPAAIDAVLAASPGAPSVSLVGCSLGASLSYAYLAHNPTDHRVGAMISVGGPLVWREVNPLVRLAFVSPELAGKVRVRKTRALAKLALPFARKAPRLFSLYMNASRLDLSTSNQLVKTVDDPNPKLNREIAHWIKQRDLILRGVNTTEALAKVDDVPLLCIMGNKDGVVPINNAMPALAHMRPPTSKALIAGGARDWFAHADLFIAPDADARVFAPMADWLETL